MRYYIDFASDGAPLWHMEYPYANETMTEVSREEYVRILGEHGIVVPPISLTPDQQLDLLLTQLQEDNKLLRAQLTATIQSNQTLEDCLVEMASVVYA
ncbi:MAG: hypothetical protein ABT01_02965 [Clostridium sp. SCN 57-10]|nr:MAG: hypothetical protein ABT01_02965 [Clostridium sp. SCN 57-10]